MCSRPEEAAEQPSSGATLRARPRLPAERGPRIREAGLSAAVTGEGTGAVEVFTAPLFLFPFRRRRRRQTRCQRWWRNLCMYGGGLRPSLGPGRRRCRLGRHCFWEREKKKNLLNHSKPRNFLRVYTLNLSENEGLRLRTESLPENQKMKVVEDRFWLPVRIS